VTHVTQHNLHQDTSSSVTNYVHTFTINTYNENVIKQNY